MVLSLAPSGGAFWVRGRPFAHMAPKRSRRCSVAVTLRARPTAPRAGPTAFPPLKRGNTFIEEREPAAPTAATSPAPTADTPNAPAADKTPLSPVTPQRGVARDKTIIEPWTPPFLQKLPNKKPRVLLAPPKTAPKLVPKKPTPPVVEFQSFKDVAWDPCTGRWHEGDADSQHSLHLDEPFYDPCFIPGLTQDTYVDTQDSQVPVDTNDGPLASQSFDDYVAANGILIVESSSDEDGHADTLLDTFCDSQLDSLIE